MEAVNTLGFEPESWDSARQRLGLALGPVWDYRTLEGKKLEECLRPGLFRTHVFDFEDPVHDRLRLIVAVGQHDFLPFVHLQCSLGDRSLPSVAYTVEQARSLGVEVPEKDRLWTRTEPGSTIRHLYWELE